MKTIGVIYEKGGVGKTTTAVNVSAILADKGFNVLLVDADPQSYATGYYDIYNDDLPSLYEVMSKGIAPDQVISPTVISRLDILPATYRLEAVENDLAALPFGQEYVLRDALETVANDYDYCLIDCPPSGIRVKTNVMTASDSLILTTIPDDYALQGILCISKKLKGIQRSVNPSLKVAGILITLDEHTSNKIAYKEALQGQTMFPCFKHTIRKNTTISEAINAHLPVHRYDKRSNGAQDYLAFTNELLEVL